MRLVLSTMSSSRSFIFLEYSISSSGVSDFACLISPFFCAMATYSLAPRSRGEELLSMSYAFLRIFLFWSVSGATVLESSSSEKIMLPLLMKPLESNIPANVFVKTDFPEPDSPTMAMDSFSYMSNETCLMAERILPLTLNFTSTSLRDNRTFLSFSLFSMSPSKSHVGSWV